MPEMIFIFLLALILFGPKKLPEIGREIGKFMAEFKRASNDFKYQLQTEIEKAGVDIPPIAQPGAQQSSSFTQTLLPPAVTSAISEIDSAHERLMQTARLAFEAQNFTLRPPQAPVIANTAPEPAAEPMAAEQAAIAAPAITAAVPQAPAMEAVTDQPKHDPAPARSDSASQNS